MPWVNINEILIQFNEDVGASLSIEDFVLSGIAGVRADDTTASIPTILSVSFNPTTFIATVTLSQSIEPAIISIAVLSNGVFDTSGNKLDGEWQNNVTVGNSGNGIAGGDFNFVFNVLRVTLIATAL